MGGINFGVDDEDGDDVYDFTDLPEQDECREMYLTEYNEHTKCHCELSAAFRLSEHPKSFLKKKIKELKEANIESYLLKEKMNNYFDTVAFCLGEKYSLESSVSGRERIRNWMDSILSMEDVSKEYIKIQCARGSISGEHINRLYV